MSTHPNFNQPFKAFCLLGHATAVITELLYGLWQSAGGSFDENGAPLRPKVKHGPLYPEKIVVCTTRTIMDATNHALLYEKVHEFFSIYGRYQLGDDLMEFTPSIEDVEQYIEFKVLKKYDPETQQYGEDIYDTKGLGKFEIGEAILQLLKEIKLTPCASTVTEQPFLYCLTGGRASMTGAATLALCTVIGTNDQLAEVQVEPFKYVRNFWFPYPKHLDYKNADVLNPNSSNEEPVLSSDIEVDFTLDQVPSFRAMLYAGQNINDGEILEGLTYQKVLNISKVMEALGNKTAIIKFGAIGSNSECAKVTISASKDYKLDFKFSLKFSEIKNFLTLRALYRAQILESRGVIKYKLQPSSVYKGCCIDHLHENPEKFSRPEKVTEIKNRLYQAKLITQLSLYEFWFSISDNDEFNTNKLNYSLFLKYESNKIFKKDKFNKLANSLRVLYGEDTFTAGELTTYEEIGFLFKTKEDDDVNVKSLLVPTLLQNANATNFHKQVMEQYLPKAGSDMIKMNFNKGGISSDYPLENIIIEDCNEHGQIVEFDPESEHVKKLFAGL